LSHENFCPWKHSNGKTIKLNMSSDRNCFFNWKILSLSASFGICHTLEKAKWYYAFVWNLRDKCFLCKSKVPFSKKSHLAMIIWFVKIYEMDENLLTFWCKKTFSYFNFPCMSSLQNLRIKENVYLGRKDISLKFEWKT